MNHWNRNKPCRFFSLVPTGGEGRGEGAGRKYSFGQFWNKHVPKLFAFIAVLLFFALPVCAAAESNTLHWNKTEDKVDADIRSWDVLQLLEQVARATGWKVYLDPGAIHKVSVKFKGMQSGDALHAMLGNLNFVLVPETNKPSRLYVFRVSRAQATRLIAPPKKKAEPIPNQIVVTLKPGSKTKIDDLARALGAKIIGRMDGQHAYLLQFPDDASTQLAQQQLANNPDVNSIGSNYPFDPPPTVLASDSNQPDLQLNPRTNDPSNCQLVIGLIDTPVQTLPNNLNDFLKPQIHVAGKTTPSKQILHGTAMAETILDAVQSKTAGNTSVKIQPVDVYGNGESTSTFDVANGIVQAVNNGANIINLSLGGTGDSQILRDTIADVVSRGIPVYAAAGNEPVTTPTYPAAYPGVIAVTATDSTGQLASYANRGSFIDIAAPGDNVVGYAGQSYMVEGTSTSTAFVSGAAAGLADASHDCADEAQALLQKSLPRSSILKQSQ